MESGRKQISLFHYFSRIHAIALLSWFPALISGCTASLLTERNKDIGIETGSCINKEDTCTQSFIISRSIDYETVESLDIFIFEDDAQGRLDSYQQNTIDPKGDYRVAVASTKGKKRIVMIANSHKDRKHWAGIRTYEGLAREKASLYEEDISFPTMYGEAVFSAEDGVERTITLRPLVSEIHLGSIRCDFSGREYEGEKLKDVKVYLTNVNAECRIMQEHGFDVGTTVNTGHLNHMELEKFRHPELIYRPLGTDVGYEIFDTGIRLYSYPNESADETPGSPFTMLVIEGTIKGKTWYYPIAINRDAGNTGIGRNCSYTYNITILRTGSTDPGAAVSAETVLINSQILSWDERNEEEIAF